MHGTIVLLHHFGGSSRSWREVVAQLPDCRCFAPDLRGFGEAPNVTDDWSVDASAADVAARIEAAGIENYTLVGHSMGGKIALALAMRQPEGLERLILLAPSPPTPEPIKMEVRERLLLGYGERAVAEETVRQITARPLPEVLHELAVVDILRSSPEAWRAWLKKGSCENIANRMKCIQVPTLVVAGEFDKAMTPDLLNGEVLAHLKEAHLQTIPTAAHLLPLEAPEAIADLIFGVL